MEMFGLGNNNQNTQGNTDTSAGVTPTPVAPQATVNTASSPTAENNVSINGYVSPYLNPDQDLKLTPTAPQVSPAQPEATFTTPAPQVTSPVDLGQSVQTPQVQQFTPKTEYVNVSQAIANKTEVTATPTYPLTPQQFAPVENTTPIEPVITPVIEPTATSPLQQIEPSFGNTLQTQQTGNDLGSPVQQTLELPSTPIQTAPQEISVTTPAFTAPSAPDQLQLPPVQTSEEQLVEPKLELKAEIPTVESLAVPQPKYAETGVTDKKLDPEHDLGINKEIISNLLEEKETTPQVSTQKNLSINDYLSIVADKDGSDLHLTVGYPGIIRIDGELQNLTKEVLTDEQVESLVFQTLSTSQKELLEINREIDLSYSHPKARFRVNAYYERGHLAAAYRLIPTRIRTIEELNLPNVIYDFTELSQGLFLLTGPTGSGKSTTLAAMIKQINDTAPVHIITIEDPIEYIYPKGKALIDQRELGQDTHDWNIALRSILRQDPDVVLIGEMRDYETIQSALTIAETGHLVFATLHTNSAAESIDRIIDAFPPHQQSQIRVQLASSLKGVMSQRLVPKIGGGRECATELLIVNPAVQNLIREAKTYQIDNVISTSFDIGMGTLERSLVKMIRDGKITVETAQEYAIRPKEVLKLMKGGA